MDATAMNDIRDAIVKMVLLPVLLAVLSAGCSGKKNADIVGSWKMIGTECSENGYCGKYIMDGEVIDYYGNGTGKVYRASSGACLYFMYSLDGNRIRIHLKDGSAEDEILNNDRESLLIRTRSIGGSISAVTKWVRVNGDGGVHPK